MFWPILVHRPMHFCRATNIAILVENGCDAVSNLVCTKSKTKGREHSHVNSPKYLLYLYINCVKTWFTIMMQIVHNPCSGPRTSSQHAEEMKESERVKENRKEGQRETGKRTNIKENKECFHPKSFLRKKCTKTVCTQSSFNVQTILQKYTFLNFHLLTFA